MSPWVFRAARSLVVLAAGLGACRCGSGPAPEPDAVPADARIDAQPIADARVDAAPRDAWVDAGPCDATFIELPPTGISYISLVSHWGRWVAYDYDENEGEPWARADVYLYDLRTCTSHRVTNEPTLMQDQPTVWNDRVVFANYLHDWLIDDLESSLRVYDFVTGTFSDLLHATGISQLGSMGDYVAYAENRDNHPDSPYDFKLLHIPSQQSTLLQSTEDGASSGGDISETHFTWPSLVPNEFRGIWTVELATGQKTMIDGSNRGTYPTTWGDWVVWEDWRSGGPDLWGVRMGAGEQVHVTDNGAYNGYPRLRDHLLCFRTTRWAGGLGWDLALMDLDTWAVRRVTPTTHPGYQCVHAHEGWLVYRKQVQQNYVGFDKIYALDLVAAGILDSQGHVIPE